MCEERWQTGQEAVCSDRNAAGRKHWSVTIQVTCVRIIRSTLYLDQTVGRGGLIYRCRYGAWILQSALPKSKNISFSWQHICLGVCALNMWEGILSYQLFICFKLLLNPFLIYETKREDSPLLDIYILWKLLVVQIVIECTFLFTHSISRYM
jgi:hypothetical protein